MTAPADTLARLGAGEVPARSDLAALIAARSPTLAADAARRARKARDALYGRDVYLRGLIEWTNYCKNDCYYCGIRRGNGTARRYRLSADEILSCCAGGWELGLRTFVLQGGEDPELTPDGVARVVAEIRKRYPECAVTLSLGEQARGVYRLWYEAGADRYLLRHETADPAHYRRLHPPDLSCENRKRCLRDLRELGYQVGAGFLVGSPFQTPENLADDLLFLYELRPHMAGIGPFIPHRDTPFSRFPAGSADETLYLLSLVRLLLPEALLPATTALATRDGNGYLRGMRAGANVVMPNLTPAAAREKYALYENKAAGDAAAKITELKTKLCGAGYAFPAARGDSKTAFPARPDRKEDRQ